MSLWTPEWQIRVNGNDYTTATVANLTVTRGRSSIYEQPVAGYAYLQLLDVNGDTFDIEIGHQIAIRLKNSTGGYVTIYGGYITDISTSVVSTGSTARVMGVNITALGALSRLARSTWSGALVKDDEGAQIYEILQDVLADDWQETPAAITWDNYTPATDTWNDAGNIGLGAIDTGIYEMVARSADDINAYTYVAQLANSALGTIYEDDIGRVAYDNQEHRQDYLLANGFTTLSANEAYGVGLRSQIRSGDMRNDVTVIYKNGQSVNDSDATSIANYGRYSEIIETTLDLQADAELFAERLILLRSFPRPILDSVTYPLASPELDDTDRDALLDVFLGQPVEITDLPSLISTQPYQGYIEGWTFQAGVNNVDLTIIISPLSYSGYWQRWEQVNPAESWNSILNTLEWQDAIGVIS